MCRLPLRPRPRFDTNRGSLPTKGFTDLTHPAHLCDQAPSGGEGGGRMRHVEWWCRCLPIAGTQPLGSMQAGASSNHVVGLHHATTRQCHQPRDDQWGQTSTAPCTCCWPPASVPSHARPQRSAWNRWTKRDAAPRPCLLDYSWNRDSLEILYARRSLPSARDFRTWGFSRGLYLWA